MLTALSSWIFFPRGERVNIETYSETLTRLRTNVRRLRPNLPTDYVLLLHGNHVIIHKHQDKEDNGLIQLENFTASFILTRFSAFRLSTFWPSQRGFKRQTLCQEQGSENFCDEVGQWIVNRILRGWDTCSYSKAEHCFWEKQWLCRETEIGSIEDQLNFDVWYIFLCG